MTARYNTKFFEVVGPDGVIGYHTSIRRARLVAFELAKAKRGTEYRVNICRLAKIRPSFLAVALLNHSRADWCASSEEVYRVRRGHHRHRADRAPSIGAYPV